MTDTDSAPRRKTYWDFPYPHYRQMQRETPVHYDAYLSAWMVTSYAGVLEALHHPGLSSAWLGHRADLRGEETAGADYVRSVFSRWFVLADAPEHPLLRKAVNRAFTPREITGLGPRIQELATGLVRGAVARGGTIDAMEELTTPLSAGVIAHLLGMGPDVAGRLPAWGAVFAKYLANSARTDVAEETAAAVREMSEVVRRDLPGAPPGSLLHGLAHAAESEPLSLDDLVSTVALLLYAGLESTSHQLGLGLICLMERPELREHLAGAPKAAMAAFVEELLRYDTSVLQVPRIASADLTLDGEQIRAGDLVVIVLGAANHDERRFEDPDSLDVHRGGPRHLSFGHGAHFCVGAALARAEADVFFGTLLREAPGFAPAGPPRWGARHSVRTLERLPVALGPAGGGTAP